MSELNQSFNQKRTKFQTVTLANFEAKKNKKKFLSDPDFFNQLWRKNQREKAGIFLFILPL
jgi:hypothetical protein